MINTFVLLLLGKGIRTRNQPRGNQESEITHSFNLIFIPLLYLYLYIVLSYMTNKKIIENILGNIDR